MNIGHNGTGFTSILGCIVGLCLALAFNFSANAADIPTACPGADAWVHAQKVLRSKEGHVSVLASDRKLHDKLVAMAKNDTSEREALIKSQGQDQILIKRMEASDANHLAELHRIAPNGVLPSVHVVGTDGMNALMLLVQHANGDHEFQQAVLKNLHGPVQAGEIDGQAYALLTDRVLLQNNEPQIYGTQMSVANGTVHLYKVKARSELEQRRKKVGLMPMKDYECMISMSYKMPFDSSGTSAAKSR